MQISWMFFPLALLAACPTQEDAKVNDQTRQAGEFVQNHPDSPPEVQQAGKDITENSVVLSEVVGVPEKPVPYSPQTSAQLRAEAVKAHQEPPGFLGLAGKVLDGLGMGGVSAILLGAYGLFEGLRRRKTQTKLTAVYHGVEEVKTAAKAGTALSADGITAILRTVAGAYNVYQDVRTELKQLREKGKIPSVSESPHPTS